MHKIQLEIQTTKLIRRGIPCRRIIKILAYDKNQLPIPYLEQRPNCFIEDGELQVNGLLMEDYTLDIREVLPETEFQTIFGIVKSCGERVHKIGEEVKLQQETWKGQEDFKI